VQDPKPLLRMRGRELRRLAGPALQPRDAHASGRTRAQQADQLGLVACELRAQFLGQRPLGRPDLELAARDGHDDVPAAKLPQKSDGAHIRICSTESAAPRADSGCRSHASASTQSAKPDSVGSSNRARNGISTPNRSHALDTTCVASNEWPPSSKKLSCTPTRSSPSTSAQIPATISSTGVRGATYSPRTLPLPCGAGSARRST